MTWDVLDTDVPRSSQYTYRWWVRFSQVHADERRRSAGLAMCTMAHVSPSLCSSRIYLDKRWTRNVHDGSNEGAW